MRKLIVITCIALLPTVSFAALKSVDDGELHNITGQAGVSIGFDNINLDLTIGSIQWTDTDADGGTVSLNGIDATGVTVSPTLTAGVADVMNPLTIDVINATAAITELNASIGLESTLLGDAVDDSIAGYVDQGIVRIGLPSLTVGIGHVGISSITVNAVDTVAALDTSFGAIDINNVALTTNSGTLYVFAH